MGRRPVTQRWVQRVFVGEDDETEALVAHDGEGFTEFAAAGSGRLFRTAWLLTGDWHLAEDLVQETLGRLYRMWHRRRPDNPAAYARTTLVRTYVSHRRRRSSDERPAESLPEATVPDDDVALRVTLMSALGHLEPKDRAVLVLRYWEDRSVQETATELDMSPGAVRSRCLRALERLRVVLGDDAGGLLDPSAGEVSLSEG